MSATFVFFAMLLAYVGLAVVAALATQAAARAARRADLAQAEAARATAETRKARADLARATRMLLAEVDRAERARSMLPVVPPVIAADEVSRRLRAAHDLARNTTYGKLNTQPTEYPADVTVPVHAVGDATVTPMPTLVDGRASVGQLAGACGQHVTGLPISYGDVEDAITRFYEGRG